MQQIDITADNLVRGLLKLSEIEHVSVLDSCGVGYLGSHLLIAGIRPIAVTELRGDEPEETLSRLSDLVNGSYATIFTLSYDLGRMLLNITTSQSSRCEPDVFAAVFDTLIVHDYTSGTTHLVGDTAKFASFEKALTPSISDLTSQISNCSRATSNFARTEYFSAVEAIKEHIRSGDTYQTNLTQQITVKTSDTRPQDVFWRLRRDHPAPFAAFITRGDSTVVSASPERFFKATRGVGNDESPEGELFTDYLEPSLTCGLLTRTGGRRPRQITTSPIKGTRRRGLTSEEDARLRTDLLISPKDRAENTMIVDLLRNDLGRVCEYGSVHVDKLCDLEEHPTLFHLVSTVSGELREDAKFTDILAALFPCGSITGAPKISTMRIIDELEPTPRGLSMGAIGYSVPDGFDGFEPAIDLSVAIRTIVFRDGTATFNVGGGITIDSDPEEEYEESLLKAGALLTALGAQP